MWLPPIRLRHLLAVGVLGVAVVDVAPRAQAAWDVHALGPSLANYAACMAGPTGPEAIRDDATRFRQLVRRRLVAAAPDEAPFVRCGALGRELTGLADTERVHAATARSFAEYGSGEPGAPGARLDELGVGLEPLAQRAQQAWPFVRDSYVHLIRPTLGAREAMHPVPPARPGLGRGLPAERTQLKSGFRAPEGLWLSAGQGANLTWLLSVDGGITFRRASRAVAVEHPGVRCGGPESDRWYSLSSGADGSLLVSMGIGEQEPVSTIAVEGEHQLLAAACDGQALVLAARTEQSKAATLRLCGHQRSCVPLSVPRRAPFAPLTSASFDLSRIHGATVLAVEQSGIVRVVSSRDDGRTWTPPSVAFDAAEYPEIRADVSAPNRLAAVGSRLFLYGARSRSSETYPLLVSDDQGASFRELAAEGGASAPRLATSVASAKR